MRAASKKEQRDSITQGSRARPKRAQSSAGTFPSDGALELAGRASKRVKGRTATIRHGFMTGVPGEPNPPLAELMRGSKGAALRIKLYLTLLWLAGGGDDRHSVTFPARLFAELLDLDEPEGRGDRRVREAIKLLERKQLIRLDARKGQPSVLYLLREDGCGQRYTRPADDLAQKKKQGNEIDRADYFVQLPDTFWTLGWVHVLGAPGLAILLILLEVTQQGKKKAEWLSPSQRRRYGLSDDSWT